jgi:hypothetical protein
MKLKTILYAAAAMLLAACSNDDAETAARIPLTVKATILGAETRATSNDDGSESFEKGDAIQLFIKEGDNTAIETEYEFDGNNFVPKTTDDAYYFGSNNTATVTFIAHYYFPTEQDKDKYDYGDDENIIDQSKGLLRNGILTATTTGSVRNPEITLSFKHMYAKITLLFSSAVEECIVTDYDDNDGPFPIKTKCFLSNDNKRADAIMKEIHSNYLDINVKTKDGKSFSGKINNIKYVDNVNYIYNIRINDKLTVESGTIVTGFTDSNTIFTGEESNSDQDVDHDDL